MRSDARVSEEHIYNSHRPSSAPQQWLRRDFYVACGQQTSDPDLEGVADVSDEGPKVGAADSPPW